MTSIDLKLGLLVLSVSATLAWIAFVSLCPSTQIPERIMRTKFLKECSREREEGIGPISRCRGIAIQVVLDPFVIGQRVKVLN